MYFLDLGVEGLVVRIMSFGMDCRNFTQSVSRGWSGRVGPGFRCGRQSGHLQYLRNTRYFCCCYKGTEGIDSDAGWHGLSALCLPWDGPIDDGHTCPRIPGHQLWGIVCTENYVQCLHQQVQWTTTAMPVKQQRPSLNIEVHYFSLPDSSKLD